jgi:signal transduction histidine kinase/CheY-like chemotaxis protein
VYPGFSFTQGATRKVIWSSKTPGEGLLRILVVLLITLGGVFTCLSTYAHDESTSSTSHEISWDYLLIAENTPADRVSNVEHVLNANDWQAGQGVASFAYDGRPKWLRYNLPPDDELRIFTLNNAWLIAIDVYLMDGSRIVEQYATGTSKPQSAREVADTGFVFGITPGVSHVYIFDHGKSASYFPAELRTTLEYSVFSTKLNTFHGLYYGILLIMILYNLAIFVGTRDKAYLFYSLYAASLVVFLSTADGTGSLFLWPETPELQNLAVALGWGFAFILLLEFAARFLALETNARFTQKRRLLQAAIGLVTIIVAIFPGPGVFAVQTVVSIMLFGLLFSLGAYTAARKVPNGRTFVAANGALALGGMAHIAVLFAWVQPSIFLQYAIHIGSIAELALFSIGLTRHLRDTDRARYEAFLETQELYRRNRELSTAKTLAEEHRQLQKSLQQAQKLKTIGQLAGGFAHDFNNILASILGFAELAQDKSAAADRATLLRYLQEIQKSGERGATLVKQLLVYSRNTASKPTDLDVSQAITEAAELLRGSLPPTVGIKVHLPQRSAKLFMDPEQLQQVLVNLCINAAESMHNRGEIDIHMDLEAVKDLSCTSCLSRFNGELIAIKVEDTGAGIRGNAEQLFTPFHTSKDVGQGTGLGLSVVHGIVHEHGGHIRAQNRAGGGARFTIYLPLQQSAVAAPVKAGTKRILLIEDDASVASYLQSLLDDDEYQTTFARMPTEALETFVANPDAFDLVITDYLMPQGTGLELAEDLHALRPDLPIILTTGNANNLDKDALDSASVDFVFEKPLNSEALLAKIRGLLAG